MIFIACLHPLTAIRTGDPNKPVQVFKAWLDKMPDVKYIDRETGELYEFFEIPCGRCLQCRLAYARNWSNRLLLESKYYADNWFLTLTYSDDDPNLCYNSHGELQLNFKDHQDFMKRLRAYYDDRGVHNVRFYLAGEYGDTTVRPHYHMIALNMPINDLRFYARSELGDFYYNSDTLNRLWKHGHVVIGEVTASSASYTARYVQKKAKQYINYEELDLVPEGVRMSRRPGIAADYLADNLLKVYEDDHIYLPKGKIGGVPRYFDQLAEAQGFDLTEIKAERARRAKLVKEFTKQAVSVEWQKYCTDLEDELTKKSRALRRYL